MTTFRDGSSTGRIGSVFEDMILDALDAAVGLNPVDYDAVGDGSNDDYTALNSAAENAASTSQALSIGSGTFAMGTELVLPAGLKVVKGLGTGLSTLKSEVAFGKVLQGVGLSDLRIAHLKLTGVDVVRDAASIGLYLEDCSRLLLEDILVDTGVSAGIMSWGGEDVMVRNCRVRNTLADGIHITNGDIDTTLKSFSVIGCHTYNTGDDGIAIVNYDTAAANPEDSFFLDATITGNVCVDCGTGGIAAHGGGNITISSNAIDGTWSHGIAVDSEGAYGQTSVRRIKVIGNTLNDVGQNLTAGFGDAILVSALESNTTVSVAFNDIANPVGRAVNVAAQRVAIHGNTVDMDTSTANPAVSVGGSVSTTKVPHSTQVTNNKIYRAYGGGIAVVGPDAENAKGVVITGNYIENANSSLGATNDGILVQGCDHVVIKDNVIVDAAARLRAGIFVWKCNNVVIGGNVFTSGATSITLLSCTNVLRENYSGTAVPSDTTTYVAGQTYTRTTTGVVYAFDGAAWVAQS